MGQDLNRQLNRPNDDATTLHDSVGAYLLDALPNDEVVEFEAHLATCAQCQQEVRELRPVIRLLPRTLELERDTALGTPPAPSLRSAILAAIHEEAVPPTRHIDQIQRSPAPVPLPEPIPFERAKPRGRIRGGSAPSSPWETIGRLNASWLAAAVAAIVAVGAIIWALAQQGTIDNKQGEIDQLRKQNNASAFHLGPVPNGQANVSGTLLYSLQDKTGVLLVHNLPALPTDKVYQLWYIRGTNNPEPGGTFGVDAQGVGLTEVNSNVPTYDIVALTEEPVGGSQTPSSPILLSGQLSGAAGAIPGAGIAAVNLAPPDGE